MAHAAAPYVRIVRPRYHLNNPLFADTPMILEMPKSEDMHEDVENLKVLRRLIQG